MLWKKKRRVHMSGISVLFTFCGCILVLGNIYVMYNGFLQVYEDPRNVLEETLGVDGVLRHTGSNIETLHDVPIIALPDSLRKVPSDVHNNFNEPKLRRLMDNDIDRYKFNNGDEERISSTSFHPKSTKQSKHVETRRTAGRKISVSDSQLRAALNKTSDCVKLHSLTNKEYIASGWTKAVYKTNMDGQPVALKKVDLSAHDMTECGQELSRVPPFCYKKASQKILKELLLLKALKIPNVVQVIRNIFLRTFYPDDFNPSCADGDFSLPASQAHMTAF